MTQDVGRSPLRGSGCQPTASAADASSRSGIPNALRLAREIALEDALARRQGMRAAKNPPAFYTDREVAEQYRCGRWDSEPSVRCALRALHCAASGIEAATADETRSGSAEGESPTGEAGDAQTPQEQS